MLGIGGGGTRLPDVGSGLVASVPASVLGCPPVFVGGGGGKRLPDVNPPAAVRLPPAPPGGGGGTRLPDVNPPVSVTTLPPDPPGGGSRLPEVKPPVFPALPACAVPAAPPDDPGSDVNVPLHAYETVATPTDATRIFRLVSTLGLRGVMTNYSLCANHVHASTARPVLSGMPLALLLRHEDGCANLCRDMDRDNWLRERANRDAV